MAEAGTLRGVAILQRGTEDIVAVAGGPTGTGSDAGGTLGTRFQIASVTRQFTAAAVLLLTDRGALSVDDPVRLLAQRLPGGVGPDHHPSSAQPFRRPGALAGTDEEASDLDTIVHDLIRIALPGSGAR